MESQINLECIQVPAYKNDLERFSVLESMVWEEIEQQCANIDRSIFKLENLFLLSQTAVALLLLSISVTVILPYGVREIIEFLTRQFPLRAFGQSSWLLSLFIWAGGGLLFLVPFLLLPVLPVKILHKWKLVIYAFYLYIWQPFCTAIVLALIPLNQFTWIKFTGRFLAIVMLAIAGVIGIIGFLFLLRGLIIQNVSFLLTLISLKRPASTQSNNERILPDKTNLALNVISVLQPKLTDWDNITWQNISKLVEHKSTEGEVQTQSASFILAALALLGLIPIIVSNGLEFIFTKSANFLGSLSFQSEPLVKAEDIQWVVVFLLIWLTVGAIYYFLKIYQTSFVYEIIKVLCVTMQKSEANEQSPNLVLKEEKSFAITPNLILFQSWLISAVLIIITLLFYGRIKSQR